MNIKSERNKIIFNSDKFNSFVKRHVDAKAVEDKEFMKDFHEKVKSSYSSMHNRYKKNLDLVKYVRDKFMEFLYEISKNMKAEFKGQ